MYSLPASFDRRSSPLITFSFFVFQRQEEQEVIMVNHKKEGGGGAERTADLISRRGPGFH